MTCADSGALLRSCVYGAAVGDALGVPFEFKARGTFACTGMTGGGTYGLPAGTWSDDTSLLLATCDSIRSMRGGIDTSDMLRRFRDWYLNGSYTPDGECFDIGNATATALRTGRGCTHEGSNGNGSLMRIAPLAFTGATDDQIRAVSAITHGHTVSRQGCVAFVHVCRDLAKGRALRESVAEHAPRLPEYAGLDGVWDRGRDEVSSSGYVVHTLEASIWCLDRAGSYEEAVLEAVNLGLDTDTTACVTGAMAGIVFGLEGIPATWREALRGKDVIEACLF